MEITWYGHSCFRITERGMGTVVCDPYDHQETGFEPLKLKADIVTSSCDLSGHRFLDAVKSDPFLIAGPGEYEVSNVFIDGYRSDGRDGLKNTVYVIEYNGIFIAHLGNIGHIPSMSELENWGTIHIMLIPVGGGNSLNTSKAVDLISQVKPNIVIPMHYADPNTAQELDPLSKFLKEMGITQTEDVYSSLKITNMNQLPEETRIVILNHPGGNMPMPADDTEDMELPDEPGESS